MPSKSKSPSSSSSSSSSSGISSSSMPSKSKSPSSSSSSSSSGPDSAAFASSKLSVIRISSNMVPDFTCHSSNPTCVHPSGHTFYRHIYNQDLEFLGGPMILCNLGYQSLLVTMVRRVLARMNVVEVVQFSGCFD